MYTWTIYADKIALISGTVPLNVPFSPNELLNILVESLGTNYEFEPYRLLSKYLDTIAQKPYCHAELKQAVTAMCNFHIDLSYLPEEVGEIKTLKKNLYLNWTSDSVIKSSVGTCNKACNNCKFLLSQDYGYSNYTTEGTEHFCMKSDPKFDKLPSEGFVNDFTRENYHCDKYVEGSGIDMDVDHENYGELSAEDKKLFDEYKGEYL